MAKSSCVVTPLVRTVIERLISIRNPEDWSKAKPDDSENVVHMEEPVTEELRKLTVLTWPKTISLVVELNVGADGVFQIGFG